MRWIVLDQEDGHAGPVDLGQDVADLYQFWTA
jgi:hypothetical protein